MKLNDASRCSILEFSRTGTKGTNLNLVCVIDVN